MDFNMNDIPNASGSGGYGDFGVGQSYNPLSYRENNWKVIPLSLLAGLVSWIVCWVFYNIFVDALPRTLLLGLIFLMLAAILSVVLFTLGSAAGSRGDVPGHPISIPIGCVVMLLAASLFQFLYGLTPPNKTVTGPSSYIFVIDNSGSMDTSDPEGKRYEAIQEILQDEPVDFPFMVYGFDSSSYIMRDMAPKSESWVDFEYENGGGTSILGTLNKVIDDYSNGSWDGGNNPRVVLLTDGYATDIVFNFGVNSMLKKYGKNRLSVSCVGLGDVDKKLLDTIASKTDGVFIDVDNTSALAKAMRSAATTFTETQRDLVTVRTNGSPGVLYAILRILFLVILGLGIGFLKLVAYGDGESAGRILLITLVGSGIGALLLEIGTSLGVPDSPLWLALWLLYAFTIAEKNGNLTNTIYGMV